MEKLVYLVWDRPSVDGAALRSQVTTEVGPALLARGAQGLEVHVDDDLAPIPGPMPPPDTELPVRLAASLWLDAHDRRSGVEDVLAGLGERRAGYLVTESLWCDYGGNDRHGPRDWPAGTRSPGITTFTVLRRNPALDPRTFRELWYGHQSPMSEATQPRWRYVRNTVAHPVTPGAPPYDGIVHETFPSAEVVADPIAFHGGPAAGPENLRVMLDSVSQVFDLAALRSVAVSEYLFTDP